MHISKLFASTWLVVVLTTAGCASGQETANETADTVYLNGRIYTVNETAPWAEALAIADGKLIAVGDNADVDVLLGDDTEVIDLNGAFVMPGIQDAHIHMQMAADFALGLSTDPDRAWLEIAESIAGHAENYPEQEWIVGGNLPWLTHIIGDNEDVAAHKSTFDQLVSDRPLALWDVGGHAMLVNSKALEAAGIDNETPDPPGGTIERDEKGAATGVLRELAANLITEVMPVVSVDSYAAALSDRVERLNGYGITSVNEAWVYPNTLRALKKLDDQGALHMRVAVSMAHPVEFVTLAAKREAEAMIASREDYRSARVKPDYVKFVLDGSAGGQTLALNDPYEGSDFRGDMRNEESIVISEVSRLHAEGIGSVLHAVGDRAIRVALNAIEQAKLKHGETGARHVIAHTVFVNPEDLHRFVDLGVIAEFSPYFWLPSEGLEIVKRDLGVERTDWGFPVDYMIENGVQVAAGSDWPVVFDPNPFPAIEAMVTRELPGGSEESYGKQHAVTLDQALAAFTMGGAYELYQEETTGSLEAGKFADFIVLDRNLLEIDVRKVHRTKVLMTILEGEVVYRHD